MHRRCVPIAYFVDDDLKDDQFKKLKGFGDNGKLQYRDAADRLIPIPGSFKGFDQAFDAMQKTESALPGFGRHQPPRTGVARWGGQGEYGNGALVTPRRPLHCAVGRAVSGFMV